MNLEARGQFGFCVAAGDVELACRRGVIMGRRGGQGGAGQGQSGAKQAKPGEDRHDQAHNAIVEPSRLTSRKVFRWLSIQSPCRDGTEPGFPHWLKMDIAAALDREAVRLDGTGMFQH